MEIPGRLLSCQLVLLVTATAAWAPAPAMLLLPGCGVPMAD